ncbi:MAG TPA: 4'-phosphopantetheinyl transferase superfamily protein [Micromonosporaceae bacterium]|jgi:4'-phosphopantetheinyl transferase EntD
MTIEAVLPPVVVAAEATADDPAAVLFPEEDACVRGALDARRREYATVRQCARRALAVLGLPAVPIPSGVGREPLWPPGVVGSMTHCDGYRAAAVARAAKVHTIGIDAEPDEPLPEGVGVALLTSRERVAVRELAGAVPAISWDRLVFSAKEAVFKAWYPLTHTWLDFEDAEIALNLDERSFLATVTLRAENVAGSAPSTFAGRWSAQDGLLVAAVSPAATD